MCEKVTYNVTLTCHFSVLNFSEIFDKLLTNINFSIVIVLLFCQMVVEKGWVEYVG